MYTQVQKRGSLSWLSGALTGLAIAIAMGAPAWAQIGDSVAGVGPINRAMGGAAVAAPIDSAGALLWNPASITGLGHSEMELGAEMMFLRTGISSKVAAGAMGPFGPPTTLMGHSGGNDGVFPLPAFGAVWQPEDSPWTFGLGLFEIAGFGVNYAPSRTNPVLMPGPPYGMGVGALYSNYQLMQIAPTVAYKVTDTLSIGISGDFDISFLGFDPGFTSNPSLVPMGPGMAAGYPSNAHMRGRLGGGFALGAYYNPGGDWAFGVSVKSPQWFDSFSYNYVNANGTIGNSRFRMDYPLVASVGTAYTGIDRLLVALDLRFLDYRDTIGFRDCGFTPQGAIKGFGWQDLFALALGTQYKLTDTLTVRAGYTFSMSPVGQSVAFFNIPAPTIMHSISVGASYNIAPNVVLSAAYIHYFDHTVEGPMYQPMGGPIPGTAVRDSTAADSALMGVTMSF